MSRGKQIKVAQGDTLSSVAFDHGLFPENIWNRPENAELRRKRRHANVLLPGDEVFIPEREDKALPIATNQSHTFVRRGIPEYFRAQILDLSGRPWADAPFAWESESGRSSGRTNSDGQLEQPILPSDRMARITVGEPPEVLELEVRLGHLDPVDTTSGVRQRLANLGYEVGTGEADDTPVLEQAIRRYRVDHELEGGSQIDDALLLSLEHKHGA